MARGSGHHFFSKSTVENTAIATLDKTSRYRSCNPVAWQHSCQTRRNGNIVVSYCDDSKRQFTKVVGANKVIDLLLSNIYEGGGLGIPTVLGKASRQLQEHKEAFVKLESLPKQTADVRAATEYHRMAFANCAALIAAANQYPRADEFYNDLVCWARWGHKTPEEIRQIYERRIILDRCR